MKECIVDLSVDNGSCSVDYTEDYSILLCEYCDSPVKASIVAVPRPVQVGARNLDISDQCCFGCCPHCLRVVENYLSRAGVYELRGSDERRHYCVEADSSKLVDYQIIRNNITDKAILLYDPALRMLRLREMEKDDEV